MSWRSMMRCVPQAEQEMVGHWLALVKAWMLGARGMVRVWVAEGGGCHRNFGMKGLLFMSLLGLIMGLEGCQKNSNQPAIVKENPPPKPPNCPNLPELANLQLKDGRIADVRIFRDGDETFYVPFSWFEWQARQTPFIDMLDTNGHDSGGRTYWDSFRNGHYSFDVHQIECPGVVHVGEFNYDTPQIWPKTYNGNKVIPPNFSDDSEIDKLTFRHFDFDLRRTVNSGPIHESYMKLKSFGENLDVDNSGYPTMYIRFGNNIVVQAENYPLVDFINEQRSEYRGRGLAYKSAAMASERWRVWHNSIREFYAWLKTPPKDRDNDRIFTLGVKQK